MPYYLSSSGSRVCVMKGEKGKGRRLRCYPTRAAALKYLRALYANVKDAK